MANNIIDITKYSPKSLDTFFFDNNVWMYLFCPLGNYNKAKQKHYSAFFKDAQSCRSCIFINSMVLSEFSNRYLKLDFELWKEETKSYGAQYKKDYVGKTRYKQTVDEIKISINKILSCSEKSSDSFTAIELKNVYKHFSEIDFNDSYYIEFLTLNKWKIVTDDSDFINYSNHNLETLTVI